MGNSIDFFRINIVITVATHLCDQLCGADLNPKIKSIVTRRRNTRTKNEMVIFDTDKTIWPFDVRDYDLEVFKNADKTRNSSMMPFPEVKEALQLVKEKGFTVGLLSVTDDPQKTKNVLRMFGLTKLFDFMEIGPGTKELHIRVLRALAKVEFYDILYFQFPSEELSTVLKLDVVPLPVDSNGLTIECIQKGLDIFAMRPKPGTTKRKKLTSSLRTM